MATELAKAYVQIIPSAEGIKGKITEALGGEASSAGDSAGATVGNKLVSGVKKIVAAAGIGAAIKSAVTEGADLEQSVGGIETLFKESSNAVIENAKNAYRTAGLSANEYMEAVTGFSASLLQGLGGDTQKSASVADMAMTDMSDNANKMGTSMELIQNAYQGFAKQNYTMLDNLKLGYGGTKTEMERLLKDAQALSGVEYNIDNLSDVYEAIHVIQEDLDITGTTAKEASTTLSGSLASMKSAFKNVLGYLALGEDIKPALNALMDTISTFLTGNLIPMIGNILKQLPEIVHFGLQLIMVELRNVADNADQIVQIGIDLITGLLEGIVEMTPYIVEAAFAIITAIGSTLINTDWLQIATDLINSLKNSLDLAAGEILGTDGNIVDSILMSVTEKLPCVLQEGIEIITNLANGILENRPTIIYAAGDILEEFINFIMENLPTIQESGMTLLQNLADGIVKNLPAIISSAAEVIAQLLATILQKLPDVLETGIKLIGELAAGLIKAIPKLVAEIPTVIKSICEAFSNYNWGEIGSNIMSGIKNGIVNAASSVADAAKEAASSALNGVKGLLGIHSPSRVFENEVGKMIDLGLAAGIEGNVSQVTEAMKELSDSTVGTIDTDFNVAPVVAADNTQSVINTEINFNGTYSFNDKSDIDYFMNQAALRLAVNR